MQSQGIRPGISSHPWSSYAIILTLTAIVAAGSGCSRSSGPNDPPPADEPVSSESAAAYFQTYYGIFTLLTGGAATIPAATAELQKLTVDSAAPRWVKVLAFSDLAVLDLGRQEVDQGLANFEQAVKLGFNDIFTIRQLTQFQTVFALPRFQEIYGRMKISPADLNELTWLHGEMQAISADTGAMIRDNMGRVDSEFTEVAQVALPTRKPQSPTVEGIRMVLLMLQRYQKEMVAQSDQSRINHQLQMNIIGNMPSGSYGNQDAALKQAQKTQAIQESLRQAQRQAEQRRQALDRRQFQEPAGLSTRPEPVPPLNQ